MFLFSARSVTRHARHAYAFDNRVFMFRNFATKRNDSAVPDEFYDEEVEKEKSFLDVAATLNGSGLEGLTTQKNDLSWRLIDESMQAPIRFQHDDWSDGQLQDEAEEAYEDEKHDDEHSDDDVWRKPSNSIIRNAIVSPDIADHLDKFSSSGMRQQGVLPQEFLNYNMPWRESDDSTDSKASWFESNKKLVIGGAIVAIGAIGLTYYFKSGKDAEAVPEGSQEDEKAEQPPSTVVEPETVEESTQDVEQSAPVDVPAPVEPEATPAKKEFSLEQTVQMYTEMVGSLNSVMFKVSQAYQAKAQSGASPEEVEQWAQETYVQTLEQLQKHLLTKYGITEEEEKAAMQKYQDEPQVAALIKQFEQFNNQIMGGGPDEQALADLPERITPAVTIQIFAKMMDAVADVMGDCMKQVYEQHQEAPIPNANQGMMLQQLFSAKMPEKKQNICDEYEVTENQLDVALQKYASDPQVGMAMQAFQQQQQSKILMYKQKFPLPGIP